MNHPTPRSFAPKQRTQNPTDMKVNSLNIAPVEIHFTREFQDGNRGAARKTSRVLYQKVGPPATRKITVQNFPPCIKSPGVAPPGLQ